jgi:hypothetical protein
MRRALLAGWWRGAGRVRQTSLMRLDEILGIVRTSGADEWSVLTPIQLGSADDGPEYLAHYVSDLDIGLAWGADPNRGESSGDDGWAAWSTFPDRRVSGYWAEVLWRGTPVHRELFVAADGHRVYLPAPTPVNDHADSAPGDTTWIVTEVQIPLPRLLNGIQHPSVDLDDSLQAVGFVIDAD